MRRIVTLLPLILCGSCLSTGVTGGDNRVADELAKFDLTAGPKVLSINGGIVLADSSPSSGCLPVGAGFGSTSVLTRVDLELRAGKWVAKSIAPADGDLTLSLESAGPPIGRHSVTGTIAGTAISSFGVGPGPNPGPTHVRIVFDSTAAQEVEGDGEAIGVFAAGRIMGASRFVDTTGAVSACGGVEWTLQALPPGF
ncbi:MAG TPA: hypothetical protein VN651_03585 [Gemmatimonadaceae bacterium]|nr:hypothetical protein [Gemmatimonadaceae bacterium]